MGEQAAGIPIRQVILAATPNTASSAGIPALQVPEAVRATVKPDKVTINLNFSSIPLSDSGRSFAGGMQARQMQALMSVISNYLPNNVDQLKMLVLLLLLFQNAGPTNGYDTWGGGSWMDNAGSDYGDDSGYIDSIIRRGQQYDDPFSDDSAYYRELAQIEKGFRKSEAHSAEKQHLEELIRLAQSLGMNVITPASEDQPKSAISMKIQELESILNQYQNASEPEKKRLQRHFEEKITSLMSPQMQTDNSIQQFIEDADQAEQAKPPINAAPQKSQGIEEGKPQVDQQATPNTSEVAEQSVTQANSAPFNNVREAVSEFDQLARKSNLNQMNDASLKHLEKFLTHGSNDKRDDEKYADFKNLSTEKKSLFAKMAHFFTKKYEDITNLHDTPWALDVKEISPDDIKELTKDKDRSKDAFLLQEELKQELGINLPDQTAPKAMMPEWNSSQA